MCIICNCNDAGIKFLEEFSKVQKNLKRAEKEMLSCSKVDKRYNTKHKQLVKLRKELNRWFDEERENHKNK